MWHNTKSTGIIISTKANGLSLGTGFANTNKIITILGDTTIKYAAGVARSYKGGGYTDWFLPSRDELNKLFISKSKIGGFITNYYWSSSEGNDIYNTVWYQDFNSSGRQINGSKFYTTSCVRAIRAF